MTDPTCLAVLYTVVTLATIMTYFSKLLYYPSLQYNSLKIKLRPKILDVTAKWIPTKIAKCYHFSSHRLCILKHYIVVISHTSHQALHTWLRGALKCPPE